MQLTLNLWVIGSFCNQLIPILCNFPYILNVYIRFLIPKLDLFNSLYKNPKKKSNSSQIFSKKKRFHLSFQAKDQYSPLSLTIGLFLKKFMINFIHGDPSKFNFERKKENSPLLVFDSKVMCSFKTWFSFLNYVIISLNLSFPMAFIMHSQELMKIPILFFVIL